MTNTTDNNLKFVDFCAGIGGDNGRETAKMLQFKINPIDLFDKELEEEIERQTKTDLVEYCVPYSSHFENFDGKI